MNLIDSLNAETFPFSASSVLRITLKLLPAQWNICVLQQFVISLGVLVSILQMLFKADF